LKSLLEELRFLKIGILLYKIVSLILTKTAVVRLQIFTISFLGLHTKRTTEQRMRQYADISCTDTGHIVPLRHAFRFESKFQKPANQVNPLYIVKTDISKSVPFQGRF
jgi:hypothetical protein